MADITDIANEFIRDEIEEFIERDEERERIIGISLPKPVSRCKTSPRPSSTATT